MKLINNFIWILSNIVFESMQCSEMVIKSNIYHEINTLYEKKLSFFSHEKFQLELALLFSSLSNEIKNKKSELKFNSTLMKDFAKAVPIVYNLFTGTKNDTIFH